MLFCSFQFCRFFCIVLGLYWLLPWHRARVYLLLGASDYFYASWNKWLALLICVTTLFDYSVGLALESLSSARVRRLLLLLSLAVNIGFLLYFKYSNFFL